MIQFRNVSFTYPKAAQPALQQINLDIPDRTVCLVAGHSGAGKSTLLRCINGLVPHFSGGRLEGTICVWKSESAVLDPVRLSPQGMSQHVGFVFQDPETQFVVDVVGDEVAFALENAAFPAQEMHARVEEALGLLELLPLRARRVETLSGGERQRVAIAAALALRPHVLVLDEPTSQLDPHAAEEVLLTLRRLNRELGLTVVLAEHRLERILPFADQMVFLRQGQAGVLEGAPREILAQVDLVPPVVALGKALNWKPLPLTVEEARQRLCEIGQSKMASLPETQTTGQSQAAPLIEVDGLEVSYQQIPALRGVDMRLYGGEIAALIGPNGAGKSTLLRALVGLLRPLRGRILVGGEDIAGQDTAEICRRVGYLPQDPNALLFSETVLEELQVTLHNQARFSDSLSNEQRKGVERPPEELLRVLRLEEKLTAYPRDLSTGERQRVALGAITIVRPQALLLDEPTRGLDYDAKQILRDLLRGWRDGGMGILLVTHDIELAAATADRVILLEKGKVTACGTPAQVLGSTPHFTPQMAQLFPGTGWLTPAEAIAHMSPPSASAQTPIQV
ncbi:MAG: ABC transporter ATP-binding protein [Anaerolineales bacterium]|nr:ABC transporter ATP-binding protein [Anaerolineales bacterium]